MAQDRRLMSDYGAQEKIDSLQHEVDKGGMNMDVKVKHLNALKLYKALTETIKHESYWNGTTFSAINSNGKSSVITHLDNILKKIDLTNLNSILQGLVECSKLLHLDKEKREKEHLQPNDKISSLYKLTKKLGLIANTELISSQITEKNAKQAEKDKQLSNDFILIEKETSEISDKKLYSREENKNLEETNLNTDLHFAQEDIIKEEKDLEENGYSSEEGNMSDEEDIEEHAFILKQMNTTNSPYPVTATPLAKVEEVKYVHKKKSIEADTVPQPVNKYNEEESALIATKNISLFLYTRFILQNNSVNKLVTQINLFTNPTELLRHLTYERDQLTPLMENKTELSQDPNADNLKKTYAGLNQHINYLSLYNTLFATISDQTFWHGTNKKEVKELKKILNSVDINNYLSIRNGLARCVNFQSHDINRKLSHKMTLFNLQQPSLDEKLQSLYTALQLLSEIITPSATEGGALGQHSKLNYTAVNKCFRSKDPEKILKVQQGLTVTNLTAANTTSTSFTTSKSN